MNDDRARIQETIDFWRAESRRLEDRIVRLNGGLVRVQRQDYGAWVDVSHAERESAEAVLRRVQEIVGFFESILAP